MVSMIVMDGDIIIIYGPTAAGKSQQALTLAKNLLAKNKSPVIINADALQQYSDLPILSAQPNDGDKKICPHLLYGFLPATANNNVATWRDQALRHIADAVAANHVPIIVGGSGLYIKILILGISPMPTVPEDIKKTMIDAVNTDPSKLVEYYKELQTADPELAKKLPATDTNRIIRGLSIFRATGKPLSQWQMQPPSGGLLSLFPQKKISYHYVCPPREILLTNIATRTNHIIANGAIEEYKKICNPRPSQDLPIDKTIGANAMNDYCHDKIDLQELQEQINIATRQYAKRQATWYRGQLQHLFEQ